MAVTLKQVEALADELAPSDQLRLVQHIVPRLTDSALADVQTPAVVDPDAAWKAFREVGDRIAAISSTESMTEMVSKMRR